MEEIENFSPTLNDAVALEMCTASFAWEVESESEVGNVDDLFDYSIRSTLI